MNVGGREIWHFVPVGGKVEEWLDGENGNSLGQAAKREGTALYVVGNGDG